MNDAERSIVDALTHLRIARTLLRAAGAAKAAERVRLAITSTDGALRHARLAPYRTKP